MGAEPFSAKLRYVGAEDPEHANLVQLTVTMPHTDGGCQGTGDKSGDGIGALQQPVYFTNVPKQPSTHYAA